MHRKSNSKQSVLLLQGPVGPFFSDLHCALQSSGFQAKRVLYNAADRYYSARTTKNSCLEFSGTMQEWQDWLKAELTHHKTDYIVLFGSSRPAHKLARSIASEFNIKVISLEEGYLRTGYITCEFGGNNQHSQLTSWRPDLVSASAGKNSDDISNYNRNSVFHKTIHAALYYFIRDYNGPKNSDELLHRVPERPFSLVASWISHLFKRQLNKLLEASTIRHLRKNPGFLLVPLQVASDSQISHAARGWDTDKLIDACINACLKSNVQQKLIFKLHPLERDGPSVKEKILEKARKAKLPESAVQVIYSGRIGELAKLSSGMIVINSTSAFSALHSNVPVLVLGSAVYRHKELVTLGSDAQSIVDFFNQRQTYAEEDKRKFIEYLKAESLVPGDFYAPKGRTLGVQSIISKIQNTQ